jgi:uncharacterized protein YbbC (DUF1343 family)
MNVLPALDTLLESGHFTSVLPSGALTPRETSSCLRDKRLGLVTNHTGRTRRGASTRDVLKSLGTNVVALFSPEHGPRGTEEGNLSSSRDDDGTPIHSLYGATRRPTPEMLHDVDALVFDICDVGARFYTYASTLCYCMEECAAHSVALVVLDRPNPLGGEDIGGPQLDASTRSFVGHIETPIVHGMTLGEIALLHRERENLNIELRVAPIFGWKRAQRWHQTHLNWVAPSPNLPDFRSADWYPATCILEFSGVSVGRGTRAPFQFVGAPWLRPSRVLAQAQKWPRELRDAVKMESVTFTPTRATHQNEICDGIFLEEARASTRVAKTHLGLALLAAIHNTHKDELDAAKMRAALPLIGAPRVLAHLLENDLEAALQICIEDEADFRIARQPFLIYE